MENDIDYKREIINMLSELKDKKDAMRFLYLLVKDVYDDEKFRENRNRKKGN